MNFEQWLTANGYDSAALSETNRKHLQAAWKDETQPPATPPAAPPKAESSFDEKMKAIEAENARIEFIREATATAAERHVGNAQKVSDLRELADAAIADKNVSAKDYELKLLRTERALGPIIMSPKQQAVTDDVLEAAICQTERLPNMESHFDERTLQVAHNHFRRGIGLQQLLVMSAERNGLRSANPRDLKPLLRAAFREQDQSMLAVGPSTHSISGILSNVANKFLRVAFEAVENSWRRITTIRAVTDFKTITSYSLTGDNLYDQVAPGGEIKHGSLGERSYTNQADTYGKLIGIDRRDIINDDLGALTGAGRRLGRGAALKLNAIFWAEWLNDSSFFPTDKSLNNYDDGATDSVLSLAGLTNADYIFRSQTNPQAPGDTGTTPLAAIPKILLVPIALRTTAMNLMNSQFVNLVTATTPTQGTVNTFQGQFEPVASTYLGAANTNGSDTAWYLLADPNDISVIETCFLNGAEQPTIETADMDFDRLGIAMRGYYDFGVAKQEYRGAVKLKGAA